MTQSTEFPSLQFIGPSAAGHGVYSKRFVVFHCTDNANSTAAGEANFAKTRSDGIGTHFTADASSFIHTLRTDAAVGHVGSAVGNQRGMAIEMCGTNASSTAHYNAILDRMMPGLRQACARWGIPARWLTSAQANDGVSKGWLTHDDCRRFFGGTTHTDPGPNFDKSAAVSKFNAVAPPPPPTPSYGGSMDFYSVSGVPANTLDAAGSVCVNNGQFSIFQQGFVNWTGTEFFSVSQAAQDARMDVTWPRFQLLVALAKEKPFDMSALAVAVAAQYPANQITADVIRSAWSTPEGHAAFVDLLEDSAVQESLAASATQGVKNL